ncbi:MAG: hypothetical protein ACTILG_11080 [Sphingobacterium sp.]
MTSEILSYLIPVVSIFLTYILGTINSKNTTKHDVQKRRYEDFYVNYMTKLLAAYNFTDEPHASPLDARVVFFDLVMKHTHFLGAKSAKLVPIYYKAFLDMLEYDSGNPIYKMAPNNFDDAFLEITKEILLEAKSLSKELKYPNLSKTILEMYDV